MTIINEIPIIPIWQAGIAIIVTFLAIAGSMILRIKISRDGITVSSILTIIIFASACTFCVIWTYNSSKDVARYEITIDDNKVSSDTLEKIQKNYEIVEKNKIGYITKAIVEGPRYETVFSESEIAKMSP